MELHFYTTYDNVQILRGGDEITVWTKHFAKTHDIHISLDTSKYVFRKISEGIFEVSISYKNKEEF